MKKQSSEDESSFLTELDAIQNQLRALFNSGAEPGEAVAESEGKPALEVSGDKTVAVIRARLPHFEKADLRVVVEEGRLTLRGEREADKKQAHGAYLRHFILPDDIKVEEIQACFHQGVLSVRLPRGEGTKSAHPEGRWEVKIESFHLPLLGESIGVEFLP